MRHNVEDMNDNFLDTTSGMTTLYDSDAFIVVRMHGGSVTGDPAEGLADAADAPMLGRDGFEIVDKRCGRHVYLDGSWAQLFQQQIHAWRRTAPTQEEVEDTLEHYAGLAGNPVVLH